MIFERIRNLREDNDKKQQELADYLISNKQLIPNMNWEKSIFLLKYL